MEQRREEYRRTGIVTVRTSAFKGVAGAIGMTLMALLTVGYSLEAFHRAGATSFTGWIVLLFTLISLIGIVCFAAPVVRRRQLDLTRFGLAISVRRRGRRVQVEAMRWEEIQHVEFYKSSSNGSTTTEVRLHLAPGFRRRFDSDPGYRDLPSGFTMSKKDLAAVMEGIRSSQGAQRQRPGHPG